MKNIKNLSLGKKLSSALIILVLPLALMVFFAISEKDDLINFTRQEIAGVHYLRAAQQSLAALTTASISKDELDKAIESLGKAENSDAGSMGVTQKIKGLVDALKAAGEGKDPSDALAKTTDLISSLSDNSNITLDPDGDAYFVGDILVNQATGVLVQTKTLLNAAHDLDSALTDDHKIAYAEAHDGVATSAGNMAADLGKAIKNNADGSLKKSLGSDGQIVAAAVDALVQTSKGSDRNALLSSANDLSKKIADFTVKNDSEMERLLQSRINGFYKVLVTRLGIAFLSVLLGMIIALCVIRSITKPLSLITGLMEQLTQGNLNVAIPQEERGDEIGKLIIALKAFYDTALERNKAHETEKARIEQEQARGENIRELNAAFSRSIKSALENLNGTVQSLDGVSKQMAEQSTSASMQASSVASAAEQASHNVQTVASASEELSASIQEISGRIQESSSITQKAAKEANETRGKVAGLSEATAKISEVIQLINDIASQTNLLALNATIESARAGDAGKGFAVVANEVKTLAGQASKATEDITNRITTIQDSVKEVSEAIDHINSIIMQMNEISMAISGAVGQQGEATKEIAKSVSSAAQGTSEVSLNIAHIAQSIHQNKSASGALTNSAQSLDAETKKMQESINDYLSKIKAA